MPRPHTPAGEVSAQAVPLVDIAASLEPDPSDLAAAEAVKPSGPVARPTEGAWLGGVCQALDDRLGWPTVVTRLIFLVLSLWLFAGVAIYGVLWLVWPQAKAEPAIGLAAASRAGYRPVQRAKGPPSLAVGASLTVYGLGAAFLMRWYGERWAGWEALGWIPRHSFALLGICLGGALIWRRWDQRGRQPRAAAGWVTLGRAGLGALLAVGPMVGTIWLDDGWTTASKVLGVGAATLVLALLLAGPWLLHPDVWGAEREERAIGQTRADMAAHLHDSVLQTLAMIQRQAADPKAVAALARHQERELRQWLYGDVADEASLTAQLKATAAEIEDAYGVPIDIVTVGDAALTPPLDALVRAAREAILNAAKHSGAPRIDVYAEVGDETTEVFVRDRGRGFDAAAVGEDRMGIRGSILDRMHRHGGVVGLRSSLGEGTEVRLEMAR